MILPKSIKNQIRNAILLGLTACCLSSCSLFKEELAECPVTELPKVNISFSYTMNMDGRDKFPESVHCLDVYVFKKDGEIVYYNFEEDNEKIKGGDLSYDLSLQPGEYEAVVYGGMNCTASSFDKIFSEEEGLTADILEVELNSSYYTDEDSGYPEDDDIDFESLELHDHFYGNAEFDVKEEENDPVVVDLYKNTNTINIYLVNEDSSDISVEDFRYYIIDDNNSFNNLNNLNETGTIIYRPYLKQDVITPGTENIPAAEASFKVSKLSIRRQPSLVVINNEKGNQSPIIDHLPLLDKILAAKEAYPSASNMDDQEFLYREDTWDIICTLDTVKNTWLSLIVRVGDWVVRYDNFEAGSQ